MFPILYKFVYIIKFVYNGWIFEPKGLAMIIVT
jgi:hypothetical protein